MRHALDCGLHCGLAECDCQQSMLSRLGQDGRRVFSISRKGDAWRIEEECDNYFFLDVSNEELKQLAQEILALADS